jgi:FixJ family two-component response regulator
MERTTLHIVCDDIRSRAEQARIAFALGHHAEVYGELEELLDRPPYEGIILAADNGGPAMARRLLASLGGRGIWLPIVLTSPEPEIEQVVAGIKAGALDYLQVPLDMSQFARRLKSIMAEAGEHAARRRREVSARQSVALLSKRESEVLELLSAGCSNKEIARRLEISPRTVEIHRGNMMAKLRAGHPADAVRLWMDAQEKEPPPGDHGPNEMHEAVAGRIGERRNYGSYSPFGRRQRQ